MRTHQESREARFRRLYRANYWNVLAYAARRVPEASAHDVVAETFLVLWRRIDAVPNDEEVLPWLYGVARRTVMNQHRSTRRVERLRARLRALPQPAAADVEAAARDEIAAVLEALRHVSEDDREVLLLSAWEGLSNSEIARVLGCSDNAIAIRLHRARKRLETLYEKENSRTGNNAQERASVAAEG